MSESRDKAPGAATVVLAHGTAPVRGGLRQVLERSGLDVVAEVGDSHGLLEAAARADVCVMDAALGGDAALTAAELRGRFPSLAILVLSAAPDEGQLFDFLRAGVDGYLPAGIEPNRLPVVVEGVLNGETALPRWAVSLVVERLRDGTSRRRQPGPGAVDLTERERQVLDQLAAGRSTTEIANALGLSPVTIRRHVSRALARLGVADRAAAVELFEERR